VLDGQTTIRVSTGYTHRVQFERLHRRPTRWFVCVAHRRAGKTVACVNDLIDAALRCKESRPRFGYIAPFFRQAKDVAWAYLRQYAGPVPGVEFNEAELRCDLPNGARVRLYGADNYDAMRGLYFDGVVLDEFGDMDPRAWTSVIRPCLTDRAGWAIFIGTPRGRNEFAAIYRRALTDPEWGHLKLRASTTGLVPAEELEALRRDLSEEEYAAEFECSFDAPVVGSYYGKLITAAEADSRVCRVPYDPATAVTAAWDLGIGDDTAIWFAQQVGQEVHLLDYYESRGVGLDHYVGVINGKPWRVAEHILPHDGDARELGSGKTRVETLTGLGVHNVRILAQQRIEDGINAARNLIPRCWWDADKCAVGIEALRMYRRDFDEKKKVFRDTPLHDWSSHAADAFRYLALGLRKVEIMAPIEYGSSKWIL